MLNLDYPSPIVVIILVNHDIYKNEEKAKLCFQKATTVANQQASKYKYSYDKSIKGPQLQEKDLVL